MIRSFIPKLREYLVTEDHVEIEVRFGSFKLGGRFSSQIHWSLYDRLLQELSKETEVEPQTVEDIFYGTIRKRTINGGVPEFIKKEQIDKIDIQEYDIRIGISREVPTVTKVQDQSNMIRNKITRSFPLGTIAKADLSEVTEEGSNTKYEIEIEFKGNSSQLDEFSNLVDIMFTKLWETQEIYTIYEKNNLIRDINTACASKGDNRKVDVSILVQARNLKTRDMVYGGLIGNPKTLYTATFKADGKRKLLVLHKTGLWLVFAREVNLITREITSTTLNVIDGELIPLDKRRLDDVDTPRTPYFYLVFDALVINGKRKIQETNHGNRIREAHDITTNINHPLITIKSKEFHAITNPARFFEIMNDLLNRQNIQQYVTDGIIFTPESPPYNPHSDKYPLSARKLTKFPDICKYKPSIKLTIDFKIKKIMGTNKLPKLLLYTGKKTFEHGFLKFEDAEFKGDDRELLDGRIEYSTELMSLPTNTIVEFAWNYEKENLVYVGVRKDKEYPNSEDVAKDIWSDIFNPLTDRDMRGETILLMRKYQNRIKRILLSKGKGVLLDIGSGRGGDIDKWENYSRIIAVEPDSDNIKELERRLERKNMIRESHGLDPIDAIIVQTGGQNYEFITQAVHENVGKVDVVSLMLSMSFFWESEEVLNGLLETISRNLKVDGTLVFLTIDGDAVKNMFYPIFGGFTLTKQKLGPATIEYDPDQPLIKGKGSAVYFDISDTIVKGYHEYLVFLNDFQQRLEEKGFGDFKVVKEDQYNGGEKFLTLAELKLVSLYSFGIVKRISSSIQMASAYAPEPPIPEVPIISEFPIPEPIRIEDKEVPVSLMTTEPLLGTRNITVPTIDAIPVRIPDPSRITIPAINDDVHSKIEDERFPNLFRIACIGDENTFLHAFLKGFFINYQNNASYQHRSKLVTTLRTELGLYLETISPTYNAPLWLTTSNGRFPAFMMLEIADPSLIKSLRIDYSLEGLQNFFNSKEYIPDELYQYISDILEVDIYVLQYTKQGLQFHLTTAREDSTRYAVVIVGSKIHYELIVIRKEDGLFQSVFRFDDPLIYNIQDILNVRFFPIETRNPLDVFKDYQRKILGDREYEIIRRLAEDNPLVIALRS